MNARPQSAAMQHQEPIFTISRVFDAPRDLVWQVWTDAKHLAKWWGPNGVTVEKCDIDLKPGGIFHYALKTPDGGIIWGKWVFQDIKKPERLVVITSFSDATRGETRHPMAPSWPLRMLATTRFEDVGGKTKITVAWSPLEPTEEERKTFAAGMSSMQQGWGGTMDQLAQYLANIQ